MKTPSLPDQDWKRIETVIDTALELPASEQEAALRAALADRADLIEPALRWWRSIADTLEPPTSASPPSGERYSLHADDIVDNWRILSPVGRGGMGEVYLAQSQREDGQRVAIKLLRIDAETQRARFIEERQLLAQLQHPGIARLIDGGSLPDQRIYTVMEYVEGHSLDHPDVLPTLDLQQRLRLFLQIAQAVAYAHRRLIVHRDIKPANVRLDAEGHPKLLDFGIAKLLDRLAADTLTTQALATPAYAAPEQLHGRAVTTATDVYGLGALLHFLLTGHAPWRLEHASLPVAIARIAGDEVMVPSTATEAPAGLPATQLRGDLDAIVVRATRSDPAQRYASVDELIADIDACLEQRPVRARDGAWSYRLSRWVRRHRVASAAAGVAVISVVTAFGGITTYARQAATERDIAERRAQRANAVVEWFSLIMNESGDRARDGSVPLAEILRSNLGSIESSYADDPETGAELLLSIGYTLGNFGEFAQAALAFEKVLSIAATTTLPLHQRADAHIGLAQYELRAGRPDAATAHLQTLFADPTFTPDTLLAEYCRALRVQAWWQRDNGDLPSARASLERARDLLGEADASVQIDLLDSLANVYLRSGEYLPAADTYARAAAVAEAQGQFTRMLSLQRDAATVRSRLGQVDEAHAAYLKEVEIRRRTGQLRSADGVLALKFLGTSQLDFGQIGEARATLEEGWQLLTEMGELGSPVASSLASSLILALSQDGEPAQAVAIADTLFDAFQPDNGIGVFLNAYSLGAEGIAYSTLGEQDKALRSLEQAITAFAPAPPGLASRQVQLLLWRSQAAAAANRTELAASSLQAAATLATDALPDTSFLKNRVLALNARQHGQAIPASVEQALSRFPADHPYRRQLDAELAQQGS